MYENCRSKSYLDDNDGPEDRIRWRGVVSRMGRGEGGVCALTGMLHCDEPIDMLHDAGGGPIIMLHGCAACI